MSLYDLVGGEDDVIESSNTIIYIVIGVAVVIIALYFIIFTKSDNIPPIINNTLDVVANVVKSNDTKITGPAQISGLDTSSDDTGVSAKAPITNEPTKSQTVSTKPQTSTSTSQALTSTPQTSTTTSQASTSTPQTSTSTPQTSSVINRFQNIGSDNSYCRGVGASVPPGRAQGQQGSYTLETCAKSCLENINLPCTGFDYMDNGVCFNWSIDSKKEYEPQKGTQSNKGCWVKKDLVDTSNYKVNTDLDYPGNDIRYADIPFGKCAKECDNTPGCVGYNVVKVNQNGKGCWLKNNLPNPTKQPATDFYIKNTSTNKDKSNYKVTVDLDYPGNDIKYVDIPFSDCARECDNIPGCIGYNVVKVNQNGKGCWLKNNLPNPTRQPATDFYTKSN